jgi:hypothetical protein
MRSKILSFSCVGILWFSGLGVASATLIQDTYWGSQNHGYGDRIGVSRYEVSGMEVEINNGFLDVQVFTNFDAAVDPYGINFGDLFISVDGWNPFGDSPYTQDNASNGEDWEFVFDTSENMLFGGDFSIALSDDLIDSRYIFRNGQEVQRKAGGIAYAGSSVDLSNVGYGGFLSYSISLDDLGFTGDGDSIGLKWGMTCANDTIEGAMSVPESGSMIILGAGLLGLGATVRRRKKS